MRNFTDTLLLIAPGCPHCQSVLNSLTTMVKSGDIGRLDIINIAAYPDAATEVGTRSVPWIRIGNYELNGNYSAGELKSWVDKAASGNGDGYIQELLEQQQLEQAIHYIKNNASGLPQLIKLMQKESDSLGVKFGIAALFESLEGSDKLIQAIPELGKLSQHEKANLRGDAAYYLGLSHSQSAKPWLLPLLQDSQQDVREIAQEALEALGASA